MKKILKFLLIAIVIFLIPIKTQALSKKTDYYEINETPINLQVGGIFFTIENSDNNLETDSSSFETHYQNFYPLGVNAKLIFSFYDENKKFLTESSFDEEIMSNSSGSNIYNITLIEDKEQVKYFTFEILLLSYAEVFRNVLDYPYMITGYDFIMKVNEDNTFDISEKISSYFFEERHGIIRSIPIKNNIKRLDGTKSSNVAKITDILIDDESIMYYSNGFANIRIGNPDVMVRGVEKDYKILYKYNIGKDPLKGKDELYFNIIGSGWDTTISGIKFDIEMPKNFDPNKIGFSAGPEGSVDNQNVHYEVEGKRIRGKYIGLLNPGEALTIRIELPEGYFVSKNLLEQYLTNLLYIIPFIFIYIAYYIWNKYGKDKKVVEAVEFYPVKGYNSAEIGYFYKGRADIEDVTSLLIYLANKGYIKITEGKIKKNNNEIDGFTIKKLKNYKGKNKNEALFMKGLFKEKDEVTPFDLVDKFYKTTHEIFDNLNKKENLYKIYEKNSLNKHYIFYLMQIILLLFCYLLPLLTNKLYIYIVPAFFHTVFFVALINILTSRTNQREFKIISATFMFMFNIFALIFLVNVLSFFSPLLMYLINYLSVIIIGFFAANIDKKTDFGADIIAKVKGFRRFLEMVEKPKLEKLVEENPNYFYDILPFTYVLGLSDKWISKFEDINIQHPKWYDDGSEDFSISSFGNAISSTMSNANSLMISNPNDGSSGGGSGGGGSSGGGSSGGGSGGGGGSSW